MALCYAETSGKGAFCMKKRIAWQTWLLMAWPYSLILTVCIMAQLTTEAALVCLGVWVLLTLAVCGLGIWRAVTERENAPWQGMIVKLAHIPFYVGVFLLGMLTVATPPLTIGLILLDGLLMLTTSAYGIAGTVRSWKRAQLPLPLVILLIGGHLVFVADVAASAALVLTLHSAEQHA